MNTRLVWNFELNYANLLPLNNLEDSREELRWEARYFWPGKAIIPLNGLDERFLALSNYEFKHRQDDYTLLPKLPLNIKKRRNELVYKPLLQETKILRGYGKKIKLADCPPDLILPGRQGLKVGDLLTELEENSLEIEVTKEAMIYQFLSEPKIKLELSRLEIRQNIYFSLCVEGRSQKLVAEIARQLLGTEVSCDYVAFLKKNCINE